MHGKPLSRQAIWKMIKQNGVKAKAKKTLTPHTLRHSFDAFIGKWRRFKSSARDVRSL